MVMVLNWIITGKDVSQHLQMIFEDVERNEKLKANAVRRLELLNIN